MPLQITDIVVSNLADGTFLNQMHLSSLRFFFTIYKWVECIAT